MQKKTCILAFNKNVIFRSHAEDALTGNAKHDAKIWRDHGLTRDEFVLIFGVITITTIGVALLRAFFFFSLCMRSSIKFVLF